MLEQTFDFLEPLAGIAQLIALIFLAARRRLVLGVLGLLLFELTFLVSGWMRRSYGVDSWQIWLFRVAGVLISVAFVWVAVRIWREGATDRTGE